MRRMPCINLHILGLLQHSHETHIEALRAGHTDRQRCVGLEGSEAWDLADHVLSGLGPGCDLGWSDVGFEAEEDCGLFSWRWRGVLERRSGGYRCGRLAFWRLVDVGSLERMLERMLERLRGVDSLDMMKEGLI